MFNSKQMSGFNAIGPTSLSQAYGDSWYSNSTTSVQRLPQCSPNQSVTPPPTTTPQPVFASKPVVAIPPVFWLHKEAWAYYKKLVPVLGYHNDIDTCANGQVVWSPSATGQLFGMKNIFAAHALRDQDIFVRCPRPHKEYFYSYVRYILNPNKINDVVSISPSINYDPVKGVLGARGGNLGNNIALLNLALKVEQGIYDIKHIQREGLFAEFMTKSMDPMVIIELYRELIELVPKSQATTNEEIHNKRYYNTQTEGVPSSGYF